MKISSNAFTFLSHKLALKNLKNEKGSFTIIPVDDRSFKIVNLAINLVIPFVNTRRFLQQSVKARSCTAFCSKIRTPISFFKATYWRGNASFFGFKKPTTLGG